MMLFYGRDGVLDANDGFSGKDRKLGLRKIYYLDDAVQPEDGFFPPK